MAIVGSNVIKNENSFNVVCVDFYNHGEMKGKIYNTLLLEPLLFSNIVQFLKCMENLLENIHAPQAAMQQRSFLENTREFETFFESSPCLTKLPTDRGKLATFRIRVIFRQNASWQGTIYWLEEEKEEKFRSVLELILLMDGVLEKK